MSQNCEDTPRSFDDGDATANATVTVTNTFSYLLLCATSCNSIEFAMALTVHDASDNANANTRRVNGTPEGNVHVR